MKRNRQRDSEIRKALRSLRSGSSKSVKHFCARSRDNQRTSDIEDMYQGAEFPAERRHPEEFFGPFLVGKLEGVEIADVSISWPNLAISMRTARNALRKADAEEVSAPS